MTTQIMLDSMVHDVIASDKHFKNLIEKLSSLGKIEFLSTHIQAGQLANIPRERDIGQASAVDARQIGTAVFVFDHSFFDVDRFGTDEANDAFAKLQINNPKHIPDAMIGVTALTDADIFVTDDASLMGRIKKIAPSSLITMSSSEFRSMIEGMNTNSPATGSD